jgi:hypothetical protein
MEVGYFKVKNPESQDTATKIFKKIVNIVGVDKIDEVVFDNSHKGGDHIYVFSENKVIEKLSQLFDQYKILLEFSLKTEEYLSLNDFPPIFDDPDYREVLNNFLIENLSVDKVLDKVSSSGVESLNEMDRFILKTKKP